MAVGMGMEVVDGSSSSKNEVKEKREDPRRVLDQGKEGEGATALRDRSLSFILQFNRMW